MRDWSNADDYAFTKDLKPWQWAWQFLRRNGHYQADFQTVLEIFHRRKDGYSQQVSKKLAPGVEPESIPNAECRRKWFIWYYLNPQVEFPTTNPFVEVVDLYMSDTHLWPLQHHEAIIRLDLQLPLKPQLALAKKILQRRRRNMVDLGEIRLRSPHNWRRMWQLYLRLLDGKHVRVPHKELAVLVPASRRFRYSDPSKRVSYRLAQARRMCTEGYRNILLTS